MPWENLRDEVEVEFEPYVKRDESRADAMEAFAARCRVRNAENVARWRRRLRTRDPEKWLEMREQDRERLAALNEKTDERRAKEKEERKKLEEIKTPWCTVIRDSRNARPPKRKPYRKRKKKEIE